MQAASRSQLYVVYYVVRLYVTDECRWEAVIWCMGMADGECSMSMLTPLPRQWCNGMLVTWLDFNVPRNKMVWDFSCGVLAKCSSGHPKKDGV